MFYYGTNIGDYHRNPLAFFSALAFEAFEEAGKCGRKEKSLSWMLVKSSWTDGDRHEPLHQMVDCP
jgi:hypothetical protein